MSKGRRNQDRSAKHLRAVGPLEASRANTDSAANLFAFPYEEATISERLYVARSMARIVQESGVRTETGYEFAERPFDVRLLPFRSGYLGAGYELSNPVESTPAVTLHVHGMLNKINNRRHVGLRINTESGVVAHTVRQQTFCSAEEIERWQTVGDVRRYFALSAGQLLLAHALLAAAAQQPSLAVESMQPRDYVLAAVNLQLPMHQVPLP